MVPKYFWAILVLLILVRPAEAQTPFAPSVDESARSFFDRMARMPGATAVSESELRIEHAKAYTVVKLFETENAIALEYYDKQNNLLMQTRMNSGYFSILKQNTTTALANSDYAQAKSTLRVLSTACETYATMNGGKYPASMKVMIEAQPPYLPKDYCGQTISSYRYQCDMRADGYQFEAWPENSPSTASITISTGGVYEEGTPTGQK